VAKTSGSVRASKWDNDIYSIDGIRYEYGDLPKERQEIVKLKKIEVIAKMKANLLQKKRIIKC